MTKLKPQAPDSIAKIEWFRKFGSKYILHIFVMLSLAANVYLYNQSIVAKKSVIEIKDAFREYQDDVSKQLINYRGCKTKSPYGDPPLQVNFSDSKTAYVNYFTTLMPSEERFQTKLCCREAYYLANESLSNSIKSTVYNVLEKQTYLYAKAHRIELSQEVISLTSNQQEDTGFELTQFEFLEFCLPNE